MGDRPFINNPKAKSKSCDQMFTSDCPSFGHLGQADDLFIKLCVQVYFSHDHSFWKFERGWVYFLVYPDTFRHSHTGDNLVFNSNKNQCMVFKPKGIRFENTSLDNFFLVLRV